MLYRPSRLEGDRRDEFEAYAEACRQRMLDYVAEIVQTFPPEATEMVYNLAFSTSDALPKRERRPKLDTVLLIDSVAEALSLPASDQEALLKLTIVTQEYFDIVDDLLDDDVADNRSDEALLVSQLLVPTMGRLLSEFDRDAERYWTDRMQEVMCVPLVEASESPDGEAYLSLLDRQAPLYGMFTGLAATVSTEDHAVVEQYEQLGETIYKHRQIVLDYEQFHTSDRDPWNARALLGESELLSTLADLEERVETLTEDLPEPSRGRLRTLVALDTSAWQASVSRPVQEND